MKTFYRSEMNVEGLDNYSPSAGKPKALIEYLTSKFIRLDICEDWMPISREELSFVHDRFMVNDVMDLKRKNGFGNLDPRVPSSLLYTNGSFLNAAIWAVLKKENTFSPTSGFHHAGYLNCGGYCTFNGLMLAATILKKKNLVTEVGIIDCDEHHGDGSVDIINKLALDFISHYSYGSMGVRKNQGAEWLKKFEAELEMYKHMDVVFYQAGADPHVDDPLGGGLTTEELRKRDEILFRKMREFKVPVVWNLAGGYQRPLEKVLEIHKNTYIIASERR